jgi:hypothetical protein
MWSRGYAVGVDESVQYLEYRYSVYDDATA